MATPVAEESPAAPRLSPQRHSPPTLTMVMEAMKKLNDGKGVSAMAIKRFIVCTYPGVDPIRLKYYLRLALAKGLAQGLLVRPHNSIAKGATGSFLLGGVKAKQGNVKRGPKPEEEEEEEEAKGSGSTSQAPKKTAKKQGTERGEKKKKPPPLQSERPAKAAAAQGAVEAGSAAREGKKPPNKPHAKGALKKGPTQAAAPTTSKGASKGQRKGKKAEGAVAAVAATVTSKQGQAGRPEGPKKKKSKAPGAQQEGIGAPAKAKKGPLKGKTVKKELGPDD